MNAVREQKSAARTAELDAFAVKAPSEQPGQSLPPATYHPVEVQAEYGCVDWYQYRVQADEKLGTNMRAN